MLFYNYIIELNIKYIIYYNVEKETETNFKKI